ncbi:hypothetical protein I7I53_04217 [Histoplasma capsulatum var. duboisii H88]|uniref:C2H2 type master regulator of conidiophore development brlA n=1 Tax=Ajellomyces capsulatus (strain H88) TaxID=544711 RepID=A0A8A1LU48_AJEC8|nr:hypothetical protein I7I53_04217 [Histoplasma capsulatum var. duboisii H88]
MHKRNRILHQHAPQYPQYSGQVEVEEQNTMDTEERTDAHEVQVEDQTSYNENSMASEPVTPALEGFPNVQEFDLLMESCIQKSLIRPLIPSREARLIRMVLLNPGYIIKSAEFHRWVEKLFTLKPNNNQPHKLICSKGKPIVIREKVFKVLTRAHQQCQHGGLHTTIAQARKTYSQISRELVSQFIKICPTCKLRDLFKSSATRVFVCTYDGCGKSYSRPSDLRRHQLNHAPENIYECDVPDCHRSFVDPYQLLKHQKRHSAGLPVMRQNRIRANTTTTATEKESAMVNSSVDDLASHDEIPSFQPIEIPFAGTLAGHNSFACNALGAPVTTEFVTSHVPVPQVAMLVPSQFTAFFPFNDPSVTAVHQSPYMLSDAGLDSFPNTEQQLWTRETSQHMAS